MKSFASSFKEALNIADTYQGFTLSDQIRIFEHGLDPRIYNAFSQIDRRLFVGPFIQTVARLVPDTTKENIDSLVNCCAIALPIYKGINTGQPRLMAEMYQYGLPDGRECIRALEIGAGCGYGTSLLATFYEKVYGLERNKSLAIQATANLEEVDIGNASIICANGFQWLKQNINKTGLFDTIIVSAAFPDDTYELLWRYLNIGGRLVIPTIGIDREPGKLIRCTRIDEENFVMEVKRYDVDFVKGVI